MKRFFPQPRIPFQEVERRLQKIKWGRLSILGNVSGYPLLIWNHSPRISLGKICVSAGIHGDEPAGVELILQLLETRPPWLNPFEITFFPCLNPWGYERNLRNNSSRLDLNRQWKKHEESEIKLYKKSLKDRFFDLTFCLHEDYDGTGFYLYELSSHQKFGTSIVHKVSPIIPIEKRKYVEKRPCKRGVIQRPLSSILRRKFWPEALYQINHHCKHTLTTETPTSFPIEKRVQAQKEALKTALHLLIHPSKP